MFNGAELAGATGARAPVLFLPRPEILGHICMFWVGFQGPNNPEIKLLLTIIFGGRIGVIIFFILGKNSYLNPPPKLESPKFPAPAL